MKIISRKEAKEQGLKYYFTGKPCGRGHIVKRSVSNYKCWQCRKEDCIEYRKTDRGKIKKRIYDIGYRGDRCKINQFEYDCAIDRFPDLGYIKQIKKKPKMIVSFMDIYKFYEHNLIVKLKRRKWAGVSG